MQKANDEEIEKAISEGIVFKAMPKTANTQPKVKTKAKKKAYVTGLHGSGAAKKKAEIRQRRANRHKR